MKHTFSIILKFIFNLFILKLTLGVLTKLQPEQILAISLSLTLLAYVVGDLIALSLAGGTVAALADMALACLVILLYNYWPGFARVSGRDALLSGIFIGLAEWFFHLHMLRNVFPSQGGEWHSER